MSGSFFHCLGAGDNVQSPETLFCGFQHVSGDLRLNQQAEAPHNGREITHALMPPIPIDSLPANPFVAGQGSSKT